MFAESPILPGQTLADLSTPAVVVDIDRMERNIRRFHETIIGHGVALRPHVKAHKVVELARRQLELGALGFAAAKPSEAAVFLEAGLDDVVVAYPVIGSDKWRRLAEMARKTQVSVNVDSDVGARGLSDAARALDATLGIQVEIDSGLARCGIDHRDVATVAELCRLVQSLPRLQLEGITTHRGMSFAGAAALSAHEAGVAEGRLMVELADRLRERAIPIDCVTAGSTATSAGVAEVPGVTEVRAGAYLFYDGAQLSFGSATRADVALTVLATVVSTVRRDTVTVDAGSKTLGPAGPGEITTRDGEASMLWASEEHGLLRPGPEARPEIGERVQLVPHHASAAVDLADEIVAVRAGAVVAIWAVAARGKRT